MNQVVACSLDNQGNLLKQLSEHPCAICTDDIFPCGMNQLLVQLPYCKHQFHAQCIIPWLTERKATCPLCNDDIRKRLEVLTASNADVQLSSVLRASAPPEDLLQSTQETAL
jgi:hypothetical protein